MTYVTRLASSHRNAAADEGGPFEATVQARMKGGGTLRTRARGSDALAALRLAVNAVERDLDAGHEDARTRAAEWLSTVRRRLVQRAGLA